MEGVVALPGARFLDLAFWPLREVEDPMLETIAAWETIVGVPLGLLSLLLILQQMRADRLSASAEAAAGLHESIRQRIVALSDFPADAASADSLAWRNAARNLFKDLELACALHLDGQLVGRTGNLAKLLLKDTLKLVVEDPELSRELQRGIQNDDSFTNLRDFMARGKLP